MSYKRLLVPIADTPEDAFALEAGFLLARQFNAQLDVLHAIPASIDSEPGRLELQAARSLFSERVETARQMPSPSSPGDLSARLVELPGAEPDLIAEIG